MGLSDILWIVLPAKKTLWAPSPQHILVHCEELQFSVCSVGQDGYVGRRRMWLRRGSHTNCEDSCLPSFMSPLPGVTLLRRSVTGSYLQSSWDMQISASFHREGSNLGASMTLGPIPLSRWHWRHGLRSKGEINRTLYKIWEQNSDLESSVSLPQFYFLQRDKTLAKWILLETTAEKMTLHQHMKAKL